MIRVQVAGRRVVVSANTRDKTLAVQKESKVLEALRSNPKMPQADIVALVSGSGTARHAAAVRAAAPLTVGEAALHCETSPDVWADLPSLYQSCINSRHFQDHFKRETPIASITEDAMKEWGRTLLAKGYAVGTVDRIFSTSARILREATALPNGPTVCIKVPFLKTGRSRMFVFDREQELAMFEAVSARDQVARSGGDGWHCRAFFEVLVETALRRGEGLNIRWPDVIFSRGAQPGLLRLWRAEEIKNGRTRTIPMTAACEAALRACRHLPDGPFVSLLPDRVRHVWDKAKRDAGIEDKDCVIHALRHTCATRLLEATGDIQLVSKWLGHKSILTTAKIYAHVQTHRMVSAASMLDAARHLSFDASTIAGQETSLTVDQ
jgi:integrase